MGVKCFFLEETRMRRRWLRRFTLRDKTDACPKLGGGHDASVFIEDILLPDGDNGQAIGDNWPHDDPRWPKACSCGYELAGSDEWMLFEFWLLRRSDNGELTTIKDAPPGALWYADWYLIEGSELFRGPDGHSHGAGRLQT